MEQQVICAGRPVTYRRYGPLEGSAWLVLLHGLCEDSSLWSDVLSEIAEIPAICIDLPGFGASALPAAPGLEVYADAVNAVLEAARIPGVVLVGHSMGGYTALAFAERYASKLLGMGLFHAHPFADSPERADARKRAISLLKAGKKTQYVSQFFPGLFAPDFCANNPEIIQGAIENMGLRQSTEGIILALESMIQRPDRSSLLNNIAQPVLWILGDQDVLVPVEAALGAASRCPLSMVYRLRGVGHMGMFESAKICANLLRDFYNLSLVYKRN
jgi:pimeloyl-ACP methyl ester carboxylesterase